MPNPRSDCQRINPPVRGGSGQAPVQVPTLLLVKLRLRPDKLRLRSEEFAGIRAALSLAGFDGPLDELAGGCSAKIYAVGGFVARVTRPPDEATRALTHRRHRAWVAMGAAGAALAGGRGGVLDVGVLTVAIYDRVPSGARVDSATLGAALRTLHDAPLALAAGLPLTLDIPATVAAPATPGLAAVLTRTERGSLHGQLAAAAAALDGPMVISHGDAWPKNWLCGPPRPVLIDADKLGVGPAAHDLSLLLTGLVPGPHFDAGFPVVDVAALLEGYGVSTKELPPAAVVARAHNIAWALGEVGDRRNLDAGSLRWLHTWAGSGPPNGRP